MSEGDAILADLKKLLGNIKGIVGDAELRSFMRWYNKLRNGKPGLDADVVSLTRDNFRNAMFQAYRAGLQDREKGIAK